MKTDRFEVLDSWRGIYACMVAFYHFAAFSHLTFSGLVGNAYLFVDFFFVLSGFVIAANYRDRLATGFGIGRFMTLRFGRIYPLHFAMILPFVPIDAMKNGVGPDLWHAIVTNVLLVHGLGVNHALWLDFPSWSISVEFMAYLVFALVVAVTGKRLCPWLLPIVIGPVVLGLVSPNGMNSTYDFGLVRCLEGFALGVICFELRNMVPVLRREGLAAMDTVIEVVSVCVVAGFIAVAGSSFSLALATPVSVRGSRSRLCQGGRCCQPISGAAAVSADRDALLFHLHGACPREGCGTRVVARLRAFPWTETVHRLRC